jgi:hypothetical protein
MPRLSLQLFSPESTIDDTGITATLAMSCIHNGESTAHVHLYTYPLFGSDIHRLLEARKNLKKIPTPLIKPDGRNGYSSYLTAYDYDNYDPDLEAIKQKTYGLLGVPASFHVKTYPGDDVDGHELRQVLAQVRQWCAEAQKTHPIKSLWYLIVLCLEDHPKGLGKTDLIDRLSRNDDDHRIPVHLARLYGNFGYAYTLSRSFEDVASILLKNGWITQLPGDSFRLTARGLKHLRSQLQADKTDPLSIAAYGEVPRPDLMAAMSAHSRRHPLPA